MGTAKKPAQRTISSFFTPKPAPKKAAAIAASAKPAVEEEPEPELGLENKEDEGEAVAKPAPRPRKRALVESEDDEEDDDADLYRAPPPKRRGRASKPAEAETEAEAADDEREHTVLAVPSTPASNGNHAKKPAVSGRTSKYRFGSSQEAMQVDGGEPTDAQKRRRALVHERFVQKLGGPESILDARRRGGGTEDAEEGDDEQQQQQQDGEEEEEEEADEPGPIAKRFGKGTAAAAAPKTKGRAKAKAKSKPTPLEQQVVDIKRQHPDTVLFVEVGYKYRFFGEDARIASQNLSIMCVPGKMRFDEHPSEAHLDKFASASIPVPRLHVHVKRLVAAGYKVGIVRQRETAALKAAGDNRNAPFVRELTSLYTKGTYIDDTDAMDDVAAGSGAGGAPNTGYLLCITEKPGGGTGTDEKSHVGLVAVQPATGDVIYDEFDDGFMRGEIETRLLHIAPCELLIVGELTRATEKLVTHLAGSTTSLFGETVRIERVPRSARKGEAIAAAAKHVAAFYADRLKAGAADADRRLDTVTALPDLVTVCLSAMITHLADYGLEHVFDLTKYFAPFSGRAHMLLNGNTLAALEIYRNQTDHTTKGSLFWALDRTKTKFGKRLLRKWVGRPLLHRETLEERVAAVEEILAGKNGRLDRVRELLAKVGADLEKGLIRIYYGKCTRPELLQILQTMQRIAGAFEPVEAPEDVGFGSRMLNEAVAALPGIRACVEGFLDVFRHQAACKDDKYDFFKDESEYEAIVEHKLGIAAVEAELQAHLKEIAKTLKKPKATYVSVSGVEYLIEVPNDKSSLSLVPATWAKISGTKKHSRFHTPRTSTLLRERDQHKESLSASCDHAYRLFLSTIAAHYQPLRDTIHALATLDCLFSLSLVAAQPGYTKPTFTPTPTIAVADARHPMIEHLLLAPYVPNDIALTPATPTTVITGPNMGGKSSYVRQVALIAIMAQVGSYVPASSAQLGLLDAVYTRMGACDDVMRGESTFMVELAETSEILRAATPRSLVLLDELGRGTSTHDGVAIAAAVLEHVVREIGCLCLFVTHYPVLAQEAWGGRVASRHMAFAENGENSEDITFLYRLVAGAAHRSYGLNVARLAGIPRRCLDVAGVKSAQMEALMKERECVRWANAVVQAVGGGAFEPEKLLREVGCA